MFEVEVAFSSAGFKKLLSVSLLFVYLISLGAWVVYFISMSKFCKFIEMKASFEWQTFKL